MTAKPADAWRTARCGEIVYDRRRSRRCANPVRYRMERLEHDALRRAFVCGVHRRMLLRRYGWNDAETYVIPPRESEIRR